MTLASMDLNLVLERDFIAITILDNDGLWQNSIEKCS